MNGDPFSFCFKLPSEGLALQSVALFGGVPELRFRYSYKVPTITEEDVASAVRLSNENARPEFFYGGFPIHHPFSGRWSKLYYPRWLEDTSLGDLLARADWEMKCLTIGVKSDPSKTVFCSWAKKSNLTGLRSRLDFRCESLLESGRVYLSCESVTTAESEDELYFVEEPKMRIDDMCSKSYSCRICH